MSQYKTLPIMVSLIPIPFLYEFIRFQNHLNHEEFPLLVPLFILSIVVVGIVINKFQWRIVFLSLIGVIVLSLICGALFIPGNDGWFKPFSRDTVIMITSVLYGIGLIVIRFIVRVFEYLVLNK